MRIVEPLIIGPAFLAISSYAQQILQSQQPKQELQKVVLVPSEGYPRADILIAITTDPTAKVEWRDLDGTLLATIHLDLKTKQATVVNTKPKHKEKEKQ